MRIIVKNLPKFYTESQLEKEFSIFGKIVDLCLLKNSKGESRRVCYIGYSQPNDVIKKMNNSYLNNHKITVEIAETKLKVVTDSEERIVKYNNKIYIQNATLEDLTELEKFGPILKHEYNNGLVLSFRNVEDTLRVFKEVTVLNGKMVKISPYKNTTVNVDHYNTLFFNFESVIKRTCETEKIKKNELINLEDKDLATKISLLETNLVSETNKFLLRNNIDLSNVMGVDKKVLIVRNIEVSKVLDFVNCKCQMEVSPSKNLVLLKFKDEEEAFKCYKKINLRRFNDNVIYCEYAPRSDISDSCVIDKIEDGIKDDRTKIDDHVSEDKNVSVKLLIKNVPFQATQKDISNLFKKKFKIQGIRLPVKRDGTLRGFAFVTFDSKKTLEEAIQYFGKSTHLYGRRLVLEVAKE